MPDSTSALQPDEPSAERPSMPEGYGIAAGPEGMLAWGWVEEQLAGAHNYWIVSASRGARPHAMPVWAIWLDGALYFSTSRASRKGRNLLANPRLVVHLESGDHVVVLEGTAREVTSSELLAAADVAYSAKYVNTETGEPYLISWDAGASNVVFALRPTTVLAWHEASFPTSATRWRFD